MKSLIPTLLLWAGVVSTSTAAPVPVIYSTDLMHPHVDPDDHFDLACLYAMPEADVRAIVLDQGESQVQQPGFKPVWQLNYLSGRHVPAAIGLRNKLKTPGDRGLDQPAEHQNGVHLILQTLRDAPDQVAILFVGSARDVVAAYNREPELCRSKVRGIYGFIGDAGDPKHVEWNVGLDPKAYVGLLRSGLPFYWLPCFDGGPWKNNGHATLWRITHGQVLEQAPDPLQRYFLYMLRKSTNDPIDYLFARASPEDRQWLMAGQRNMWCGALLGLAVGRSLTRDGKELCGFSAVDVAVTDEAVVQYGKSAVSRQIMRFEIKDQANFPAEATAATAQLLSRFPLKNQGRAP